ALKPKARVNGNPIISDTPKPVTASINGTTPLAINRAEPSEAPPAASQSANCFCAPVRSMVRASVTPPPMMASTFSIVTNESPTVPTSSSTFASRTPSPTAIAVATPATGGTHAGSRVSSSPITPTTGTAASTTDTKTLTFHQRGQPTIIRLHLRHVNDKKRPMNQVL